MDSVLEAILLLSAFLARIVESFNYAIGSMGRDVRIDFKIV